MESLTRRQQQALDFILASIEERGYPPTMREIGEHMGIRSTNGVNDHLKALERKGYITREDLKSRTLRPTALVPPAASIPLLGRVAAGEPILAVENQEDTLRIDRSLVGDHDKTFALNVQGESMIDDGILDGDIVFVRPQPTADPGEIVVAMLDGEATVKRFYREGGGIRLEPANETMEPIWVGADEGRDVEILGVVTGVFRKI